MTCRAVADFLVDYLNDTLSWRVRAQFEAHLRQCVNCVEYLAIYRTSVTLGRHAFDETDAVAGGVPEALVTAILSAQREATDGRVMGVQ